MRARLACRTAMLLAGLGIAGGAHASCPAANRYSFSFLTAAAQTLAYGNSYNYTLTNPAGQSVTVALAIAANGLNSSQVGGIQLPAINNLISDGSTGNNLVIGGTFAGRTASITGSSRVIVTTLSFPVPIRDFAMRINDVDFTADQFRDWVHISGTNGASSYVPAIATPFSNNNGAGPRTDANSTVALGAATLPFAQTAAEAIGTGGNANTSNNGTLDLSIPQPVTAVALRYGNYPLTGGETNTGQQGLGIQSFSFCPMPVVTMAKTSAPETTAPGDPGRFAIPGAGLVYAITVSNADTSPLDSNALVITDLLPPQTAFRNSDFDGAGPLTTNFEFVPGSSGLTLGAANISYSNTGGASYGYVPASGADTAVDAIRIAPQGAMQPGSSFTIRFKAVID